MPASDDQVLNKQQSTTDSSSQGIKASKGKRALLCGVTYSADPDPKNHLKGSVNDVKLINKMLTDFGYPDECIRVLIEDDQEMKRNEFSTTTPTKKNIENSLKWLVEGSESGAKLVFFFSGHCYRRHDSENMNTPNNIGSTQSTDHCAYRPPDSENKDTQSTGHDHDHVYLVCTGNDLIPNCYINSTIVRPLKEGVTLYAIVDSCFSGRILDLKYTYDQKRINEQIAHGITTEDLSKHWKDNYETPSKAEKGTKDNYKPDLSKAEKGTSGGLAICQSATDNQETAESNANSDNYEPPSEEDQKDGSGGLAICLSATDNGETAESNANSGGKEILGAMTFNLTEMVKKNVTYADILKKMQELHDERCSTEGGVTISNIRRVYAESRKIEVPMLSSSRVFDVSSQKFLL